MARSPCCDKTSLKRGKWSAEEDEKLINYINENGEGSWRALPRNAGLSRCGKSCRLRWINYLRSDVKRGNFTQEEEEIIAELQRIVGNKWSLIASHLPGRTDNDIKNYWNSHLSRKIYQFRPKSSSRFRSTYPFAETFRRGVNKAKEENHNDSHKQAMQEEEEMALDPQGLSEKNPNVLDSISDWDGWSIPADNEMMMMVPRLEFDQVQLDMSLETDNINESETFSPCTNMESNSFTSLESGLFVSSSPSLVSNDICWDFDAGAAGNEVDLWSGGMSLWNWE